MQADLPKISVLIVTRNRAHVLPETIQRILDDPYPNRELIVVDGGSTDGTQELLRSYGDAITKWISEPDRGEYDGWNKANALATGDILKWIPDDDLLCKGACAAAAAYFTAHPDADAVFGRARHWRRLPDGGLELMREQPMPEPHQLALHYWMRRKAGVHPVACFVRRSMMERFGPFSLDHVCGDTEFWIRVVSRGAVIGLMPAFVVDYVYTGENDHMRRAQKFAIDGLRVTATYGTWADVLEEAWHKRYVWTGIAPFLAKHNIHPYRALRRIRSAVLRR